MRDSRALLIVVLAAALVLILSKQDKSARKPPETVRDPSPISTPFNLVKAQDGTFTVELPVGWNHTAGTFEAFTAFGPQGEIFGSGEVTVWPDRATFVAASKYLSMVGMTPQQIAQMRRFVSPPGAPVDVVETLYPQVAAGAIQNMRILENQVLVSLSGATAALVRYQYTLLPQRDALFASVLNPVLLNQNQVLMEGAGVIMTFPPLLGPSELQMFPELNAANYWSYVSWTIEAPKAVFARNAATYARIFKTYEVNILALQQKYNQRLEGFKKMNEMTQRMGDGWSCLLGAHPRWWRRDNEPVICRETRPGPDFHPVF